MTPDRKNRLLIGALAAAVVLVVGYAVYQATSPSAEPLIPATTAPEAPTPAGTPSGAPLLRIEAEPSVPINSTGHRASVVSESSADYEWSIKGGTFEGSSTGPSITWNAGDGSEAVLTCKGTNAAGQSGSGSFRVVLRRGPAITRFEAVPPVITEGSSAQLSWDADGVQKLVLDPGGQDVSRSGGPGLQVKPAKTTTYVLKASNDAGDAATAELKLKVVPPPALAALRAEPVAGSPDAVTVIADFKAGKAVLKQGGQVLAESESSPLRHRLTGIKEDVSLVLTVTNEAGAYVSNTINLSVPKK